MESDIRPVTRPVIRADIGSDGDTPSGATSVAVSGHDPALTAGDYALDVIRRQTRRLGTLHGEVIKDDDVEPLHQLRVSLRRLRTALRQFAPALLLPGSVSESRIGRVARRTSLTRDLDVLQERLLQQLLPALPEKEQKAFRPALKRLARDRAVAFEGLVEALNSSRYLKLLARLHKWQSKPSYTDLGRQSLQAWLFEWQVPIASSLFLHLGWFCDDPGAEQLHDLRKRIKAVRYSLENLRPYLDPVVRDWIGDLKQAQDHLGELHDLQVLRHTLAAAELPLKADGCPGLGREIEQQARDHWHHWQALAERMRSDGFRHGIQRHLLAK